MHLGEGLEENILAFVDAFNEKGISVLNEDGISFIEAVRYSSLVPENGACPTKKIYEAIFCLMKEGRSVELIMASFMLLKELDKRFPFVEFTNVDGDSDTSGNNEGWCPFVLNVPNGEKKTAREHPDGILDSLGFSILLQKIADLFKGTVTELFQLLGDLVLLQYLINVIEKDFQNRLRMFHETLKWTFLRESFLSTLLGSRKINFKALIKDCLAILCFISKHLSDNIFHSRDLPPVSVGSNHSLFLALLELVTSTPPAIQNFIVMIMELDAAKKTADMSGQTSRADGLRCGNLVRCGCVCLSLRRACLRPFVLTGAAWLEDRRWKLFVQLHGPFGFLETRSYMDMAFNEPKWKLQVVFQYFSKYNYKASLRSRKSDDCHTDEMTPDAFFKYFSGTVNTRNMVKKMGCGEVQLLIAHTFKACMSLSLKKDTGYNITPQICDDLILSFNSLKKLNSRVEILPIGIEAIFMAVSALEKVDGTKGV